MSDDLYQQAIKALALAGHGGGRLDHPDGVARLDNPLCGDRVTMEVRVEAGRLVGLAHQTRGCLLCSASASLIGLRAVGLRTEDLGHLAEAAESFLGANGAVPASWPEMDSFRPARAYPGRHGCVLLPWWALAAALAKTKG